MTHPPCWNTPSPIRNSELCGKSTPSKFNESKPTLFSVLLEHEKRKSSQVTSLKVSLRSCLSYHIFSKVHKALLQATPMPLKFLHKICWPFGTRECVIHVWVVISGVQKETSSRLSEFCWISCINVKRK